MQLELGYPVDIPHGGNMSRRARIRRYNARVFLSSGARARARYRNGPGTERKAPRLPPRSISLAACSRVPHFATYINNGREYSESEDTLLLPSESEALSDMRWYRDDRRVFQGRLPWRYELAPLPRECSLEYPPSCLFSAIPSSPFFLPLRHFSLSLFPPFSTLLSLFRYCRPSRFSPPYIYVFTRPSTSHHPASRPFFSILAGPFASFVPRLTPRWRQRWCLAPLSLSPFLSSSPTSNRASSTPRFYFVTASLIPALSLRCVIRRFSLAVLLRDNDR